MKDLLPIEQLKFGFPDARQYQSPLEIERFKSIYFPDSQQIDKVKSEPVYFVIGDKGTGKTALATYFINGLDAETIGQSIFLQKEDFSRFYNFVKTIPDFDPADFGEMWRALIALLICFRQIKESRDEGGPLSSREQDFIGKIDTLAFGAFDFTVFSAFKVLFSQMKSAARHFLASDITDPSQFSFYLRAMQTYLTGIMSELKAPPKKTFLFIDGLDVRPTEGVGSHEGHIANVTSLINAMWQLNYQGFPGEMSEWYRVIVLVRPDIFERLELQNVNNIWRVNTLQILYPVRFKFYRNTLLFRISDYLIYTQQTFYPRPDYKVGECWDAYLPDKQEHLPSDSKHGERADDSFISILRNTFNRPRDIIYYLDYWRIVAMGSNDGKAAYFDPKYTRVPQFRNYFNDYLLGEIRDSLAFYTDVSDYIVFIQFFHHLEHRLPHIETPSTLHPGKTFTRRIPMFSHEDFGAAYREYIAYLEATKISVPEMFGRQERFLQLLYELGLVFYEAQGANYVIWKTYADAKAEGDFRPQVRLDGNYRLHRGLARAIYKDFM
jgi:hypothetical protein